VWAKESAVSSMVEVGLCPDCPLFDVLNQESKAPLFASIQGTSQVEKGTEIHLSDGDNLEKVFVSGIKRPEDVLKAFDGCRQAVQNGFLDPQLLACGALFELKKRK
jgi:hypothetical protein